MRSRTALLLLSLVQLVARMVFHCFDRHFTLPCAGLLGTISLWEHGTSDEIDYWRSLPLFSPYLCYCFWA